MVPSGVLLVLWKHTFGRVPSLHPALPGFIATTNPSDSRPSHGLVIYSQAALIAGLRAVDRPDGSLRFLIALSASAAPFHPGEPDRCSCSLLHGRWQASPILEVGHSQLRNEAETGSLALRLTPLPSEASNCGLLRGPLGQLHGERTTSMVSTFQLTRTIRLRLTHQIRGKRISSQLIPLQTPEPTEILVFGTLSSRICVHQRSSAVLSMRRRKNRGDSHGSRLGLSFVRGLNSD